MRFLANKIGNINGIILILMNFFAIIPLGIIFMGGISSFSGIPLNLLDNDIIAIYVYGHLDHYWCCRMCDRIRPALYQPRCFRRPGNCPTFRYCDPSLRNP